jgi:hypothetical protein
MWLLQQGLWLVVRQELTKRKLKSAESQKDRYVQVPIQAYFEINLSVAKPTSDIPMNIKV